MRSQSTSGFSVIPLVLLLAASGVAWLWLSHRVLDIARVFAG